MERRLAFGAGAVAASVGVFALIVWLKQTPPAIDARVPNVENARRQTDAQRVDIEGVLTELAALPAAPVKHEGRWSSFRGADGLNRAQPLVALAGQWPEAGPPRRWSVSLGAGYAGPAVHDGRVYVLDYDEARQADSLRCFALMTGEELWRRSYAVKIKPQHGISRTVPAVSDGYAVSLGPKCHVLCVDAVTGAYRWSMDLVEQYGTKVPQWYAGQCPLIDNGIAVLAPSGRTLMLGVECATGKVVWEVPNPAGWEMSHSSVMKMTLAGREMYVYFASGGAVGVATDGTLLWSSTAWPHRIVAPSPLALDEDRLLITSGYGRGSLSLKIVRAGERFEAIEETRWTKREFACEQQTPVRVGELLFTVMPPDAGGVARNRVVCMDTDGQRRWVSDAEDQPGLGPFMVVGDALLTLSDDGVLGMSRVAGDRYERLARARVLNGHEAWAPMAYAEGRLLVRDLHEMVCLDLREGAGE